MSRIHEALQRAYLERGRTPVLDDFQVGEPDSRPEFEAPVPIGMSIDLDHIKRHSWQLNTDSFPTLADRGAGIEQFRGLRSRIYQARNEGALKTILVASGMPAEGKSFVAANLAMSMARNSIHRILLIDGDLRRPTLHTLIGAPNEVGLSDYLEGSAEVMDILQANRDAEVKENTGTTALSNLTFIPSGKSTEHSTELVANGRMKSLIAAVTPCFDWIVIDAPPVLAVTDAVEIARAADAVLLVARAARTPYAVAQRAVSTLASSRILGFVLNDVKDTPSSAAYGYHYSNYYYGQSGTDQTDKKKRESGKGE